MANLQLIREIAIKKNISLRSICQNVDIAENTLQLMISRNDIKTSVLEKISKVLNVSISTFFEDGNYMLGEELIEYKKGISDPDKSRMIDVIIDQLSKKDDQLSKKDDQINFLQDVIKMIKDKSE